VVLWLCCAGGGGAGAQLAHGVDSQPPGMPNSLLAGIKLPSASFSPGSGSTSSDSDSEPVFSARGSKKDGGAAATAAGSADDLVAWMAAEAARLSPGEAPPRSKTSVLLLQPEPQPEPEPEPEHQPEPEPEPEPEPKSAKRSIWLTEESRRMEAERERQKQQDSPPSPEESPQELARSMSDAAMAEAVEQQNKSDEKSHLPAWLRSSGVKIMAHRLHVKSTVKNVSKLQVEVDRLKASHERFHETDWPAGTLWNPNGERKERPPPPCPMDLLPDEILMGVLTSVRRAKTLLNLSQCSTRLRRLADEEPYLWCRLCAQEWGLPTHAISTKELSWSATLIRTDGMAPRPWSPMSNQWKVAWLDLSRAWAHQADTFMWLYDHNHPSDVSGKRHRLAIWQAVMYLAKFTERPMSRARCETQTPCLHHLLMQIQAFAKTGSGQAGQGKLTPKTALLFRSQAAAGDQAADDRRNRILALQRHEPRSAGTTTTTAILFPSKSPYEKTNHLPRQARDRQKQYLFFAGTCVRCAREHPLQLLPRCVWARASRR
jgi:hypothetical protein